MLTLTYWECRKCHGTGRIFPHYETEPYECSACDGTGNALVNGDAARHQRKLDEFDSKHPRVTR